MKAKLYKGPFTGKSVKYDGREQIRMAGSKKLTRKQQYEMFTSPNNYHAMAIPMHGPRIEAVYKLARRAVQTGPNQIQVVPCVHPDGSYFYEYVEGSKREY